MVRSALVGFGLFGVVTAVGLLLAGGVLPRSLVKLPPLPGLAAWGAMGVVPILGAVTAAWLVRRHLRGAALVALGSAAILFIAVLAAGGVTAVDAAKAPRPLVQAVLHDPAQGEIRLVCFRYFQPSLVFYSHRQVELLPDESQVLDRLRYPVAVYLFLPATDWERLRTQVPTPCRVVSEHRDLYRRCDVVVVTNR